MNNFKVKIAKTDFGLVLKLPKHLDEASVVIICINDGTGLVPIDLCMPHQVYKKKIQEILREYPDTKAITLIPADHNAYFNVWEHKYY